jgi:SGNH hydrolase-like domain, acetyltransferase AlgX
MLSSRQFLVLAYVALPAAFIAGNLLWRLPGTGPAVRWPDFQRAPAESSGAPVAKLDLPRLRQSVNRLPSVSFMRQAGNSVRISCGQQLSWCIWGDRNPPMLFHSVELWVSEGLGPPENRQRVEDALVTIRKYHAQLSQEGWTLVVLPVPTKLSIYSDLCSWPRWDKDPLTRRPVPADRADEIYDALLAGMNRDRIPAIDLRTIYREHRAAHPTELLYPPGETHWSGIGLKIAADAVAERVSALTGIPRRTFVPSYLSVEEVSDMSAGCNPLPQWLSRLAPFYTYRARLVNGAEGRGFIYPQNPTSLLVLAGTSYSGQYTWHIGEPVGLAWVLGMQLEECEFQNGAQAGHGSYAAFASFLAERNAKVADFSRRRGLNQFTKVVVWEFPVRDLASLAGQ